MDLGFSPNVRKFEWLVHISSLLRGNIIARGFVHAGIHYCYYYFRIPRVIVCIRRIFIAHESGPEIENSTSKLCVPPFCHGSTRSFGRTTIGRV